MCTSSKPNASIDRLVDAQCILFSIMGFLSDSTITPTVSARQITELEGDIDLMTADLPPLRNFILQSGHPIASQAHIARTVCRRAERDLVALHDNYSVDPVMLAYINRLSDYLYTLARWLMWRAGVAESIIDGRSIGAR